MEKTSKYRAAFFRRALSMLLALVLTFGDLSMSVRAAMSETEPSIPETTEAAAQAVTEAPTQAATEGTTAATEGTTAATEGTTAATEETAAATEETTAATEETTAATEETTAATEETAAATEETTAATEETAAATEETAAATEETTAATEGTTAATEETTAATEDTTAATEETTAATEETAAATEETTAATEGTTAATEESTVETMEETFSNGIMLLSEGSTSIDFSSYTIHPLDIYNHLQYNTSANADVIQSNGSYTISGKNVSSDTARGQEIIIGNHPLEGNTATAPSSEDIPISLQGLTMSESMTIKPVGPDNNQKVQLTVTEASNLGKLVVEDKARLEMILNADLTVGSITLGANSRLTLSGTGTLTVTGEFTGSGEVALNGGAIQAKSGISARSISLSNTKINANGQTVTAKETLSMADSTVENAALFGYSEGSGTLTISGRNTFSNVRAVGCPAESSGRVSVEGIESVTSSSGTTYYRDYTITYRSDDTDIPAKEDWPIAYRVSTATNSFSGAAIQGYHTASGYTAVAPIPLPADSLQPGYNHLGWKMGESEETITEITTAKENITLTAVLEAGDVTVQLDRGYEPDRYSNDPEADGTLPGRISKIISKLNAVASLPAPSRFGYKFTGWMITAGANPRTLSSAEETEMSYTVALDDCVIEGDQSVVKMEAQWEADEFGLTLFLGSQVKSDDNLEISVDGGNTWQKFRELNVSETPSGVDGVTGATSEVDYTINGRNIQFTPRWPITYGQNISEYLKRIFPELPEGELPRLRDTTTGSTLQNFAGWSTAVGTVDGSTRFFYGEKGILTPGSKSLRDYQAGLHTNAASIGAVWGIMSYTLILPNPMPAGWTLTYTGSEGDLHTIAPGAATDGVKAQQGSIVTLTTSAVNPQNFSLWGFSEKSGRIILPAEQTYTAGNPLLTYQFTMPAADVAATYGREFWIDIAQSPILFEENVQYHNKTRSGFWYADIIDGMTPLFQSADKILPGTDKEGNALTGNAYFYQWVFSDAFHVTSNNKGTQNQLTLVNALSGGVYLRDVNLTMRDDYVNKAKGSLIDGVDCESSIRTHTNYDYAKVEQGLKNVNLADYANIVINNSTRQAYTTTLHFQGTDNTVGAIMQDKLRVSGNNSNLLILEGTGSDTVNLGTAFGNFNYTVSNITVTEYTKENDFKYLFYCANQTGFQAEEAVIQAPNKSFHAGCTSNAKWTISFTESTVKLYGICAFQVIKVINSYLRVYENVRLGSTPIYLAEGAKVVIDGNLEMNYHHWSDSDATDGAGITDNSTDNWLIVKGTFCDLACRTWRSGTLICNALVLGRIGGVKGGTVIANQIINQAVGFWTYDPSAHEYGYDWKGYSQTVAANSCDDDYPFLVYHHKTEEPNTYTFSGGKIYLLGYYDTEKRVIENVERNVYRSSVKATDANNPVAQFMNPLLDPTTGDLIDSPSVSTAEAEAAVTSSPLKTNECVVLGNSTYAGKRRTVAISGAEIYAAGNITFYNDTTVSGGSIFCGGSFGSKGDLTVTGGSITATAVGNAYNLKTTMEDGTLRWKRTDIQGGKVTAGRIGAFERVSNPSVDLQPKGTVTIGTGANIEGTPKIFHDVYINYIFDRNLFNNGGEPKNPNTLRFETTWSQGKIFEDQTWTNAALTFTAPNVLGESGGTGSWNWDSLTGDQVSSISDSGIAQKDSVNLAGNQKAYDRIRMKLYAVKDGYDLIFKAGANEIKSITCDGTAVPKETDADGRIKASAVAGKKVVLMFEHANMAQDYTVLWYIDGSGIIHNVLPDRSVAGQVSFTMPNSNVEIYAAEKVTLDLDTASYTLLQDGFRTEANATPTREDSLFHYLGNLVIQQGSITEGITFDIDNVGKEQMNSPAKGQQTTNKILVDKGFDNRTNGRTVTLRWIYQTGDSTSHGIELEDEAKASFLLDGAIRICRVYVPEHADFTLKGKNNNRSKDAIYPIISGNSQNKETDGASIGNYWERAGNITLQDLTILGKEAGTNGSLCYSGKESTNTVTYKNCVYKSSQAGTDNRGWYSGSYFAYRAQNVIIDGCDFNLKVSRDWPGSFCDNSKNVSIQNGTRIIVTDNGAYQSNSARPFYMRIQESLVIDNATLELSLRVPDDGKTYRVSQYVGYLPKEIRLTNNAIFVLEQRARLKKLVLCDNSTVKVGQTGTGYLLCEDIQVNDSATLEAGGIVVAGFYNATKDEFQTETEFQNAMAKGEYIYNGQNAPGLVVSGGTVTAKEYITGDVNGKITVSGGTVTAPKIGTTGKLYGYTTYVPRADEAYIYTYERIPVGMNISITGGTVSVEEYLGGMKADVSISGGEVNLGDTAILGLTDDQQTTLTNYATANHQKPANFGSLTVTGGRVEGTVTGTGETEKGGSISVPYGTVNVSGADTGISVYNMMAYCGKMTVTGVTGKLYDNPYTGSDKIASQEKLGIRVSNRMSAKNLTITGGSVVYAKSAYANVPKGETGDITVTVEGENRAYLYTSNAYGIIGEGEGDYHYNDGTSAGAGDKNVFGTKVVDVRYIIQTGDVFLDDDIGKEQNPNLTALPNYTVVSSNAEDTVKYYSLVDASCSGYKFLGWYQYDPVNSTLTDTKVTRIDKSNASDVYLGAKWEKVEVVFEIRIRVEPSEYDDDTMELIENGTDGKNLYKFKQTAAICYGDPILTESGILLSHYTTKTQGLQAVAYKGDTIGQEVEGQFISNTRVTAEMADAFVSGGGTPLILDVPDGTLTALNALITLDQNKNDKKRPRDTKFNLSDDDVQSGSNTTNQVSQYGSITATLGDIKGFAKDGKLIQPTAPGYTFGGWYTSKSCDPGTEVTEKTTVQALNSAKTTTLYAKWTPNTYIVRFSTAVQDREDITDNRWVTADRTTPEVNAVTNGSMDYFWIYDAAPMAGQTFWVKGTDGTPEYKQTLPYAWREGYVFECWQLTDSKGTHAIASEDELSRAVMDNLDVTNFVEEGVDPDTPALILYANYRQVKVTYHLDDGKWMTPVAPTANPAYGAALAGYSKESEIASAIAEDSYTKLGEATGADGTTKYCVISTTSDYFTNNGNQYVDPDYRHTLSKKGYTFQGWKKAGDDKNYGCTPRFEDIELTAQWKANTYHLKLHVKDDSYGDQYVSRFSTPSPAVVDIPDVTVGGAIPSDPWPEKAMWYAYNGDAANTDPEKRRLLLGVTFAGLDPGNSSITTEGSVYLKYAEAVTNMLNSKTLLDKGSIFFLPEDDVYGKALASAVKTRDVMSSVPDYPDGTTIPLYGVYRERSLVFIETYVDADGVTQSQVLSSNPWNEYSEYPTQYQIKPYGKYSYLTNNGYALTGWFAGQATIDDSRRYTKANFDSYKDKWKDNAGAKGEYDINVYTVYVAQQTITQTLTANADPKESSALPIVSYTLPGSMQEGTLSYQIEGLNGLKLVSVDEMKKHRYDSTWSVGDTTYTANDTVAIALKVEKDGKSFSVDLKEAAEKQLVTEQSVGKDWVITLTLYHSKVMTETKSYVPFTVSYTFEKTGSDTLKDQWLKDQVTVELTPSLYEVTYQAILPEAADRLTVLKENSFAGADGGNTCSYAESKIRYGSTLLAAGATLTLEGYDRAANWSYAYGTDQQTAVRTNLTLEGIPNLTPDEKKTELSDGKITVSAGYEAQMFRLEKDAAVSWNITYGNGAGDSDAPTELNDSPANVKYHSVVTFTQDPGNPQHPAFITLTYTDSEGTKTVRLDQYAQQNGSSYTFPMPASNVSVGYSDVMDLYLDNGTIELFSDGFVQVGKNENNRVSWPGDYRIRQCEDDNSDSHSTDNVLILSDDLTERNDGTGNPRQISLGNLNIASDNSIELKDGCQVNLTQEGNIQAKNILVPEGTSLTLTGAYPEGKSIILTPETDRAAIGATEDGGANGSITLKQADVSMTLEAPSGASGIGPGRQDSTGSGGDVTVTDSRITVTEIASISDQYTGAWIGGAGVSNVTMKDTTLVDDRGSNHNAKAVDGAAVSLTSCRIGEETKPVKEPLHAASSLTVTGCTIYQQNDYELANNTSMIGTDSGTTKIAESTVQIAYGGRGRTNQLFTGKMLIQDVKSDITINGTQILEVSHGDIVIQESIVTQKDQTHSHTGLNYLLLEEGTMPATLPKLTVESLGTNKTITVQQKDTSKALTVGTLDIRDDTKVILDGDLTVKDEATVLGAKTLTVEDKASHGVTYEKGLTGEGNYAQTGGELTGMADVVVKGDMTLTNVTADCSGHALGSNGGGTDTATTVTVSGGSVTAKTVGACGAQNTSFTFVETGNTPTIIGNLVQDHYRLNYVVSGLNVDLTGLPTVLRTETPYGADGTAGTVVVHDSKPNAPIDADQFNCWFIWNQDGKQRLCLLNEADPLPTGLTEKSLLSAETASKGMSAPAKDGTKTLSVYAWLNLSGTVAIKSGRLFKNFTDGESPSVSTRGVWTAMLESNATFISGRDYQVTFDQPLPAGTDLTLTVNESTHYHYTLESDSTTVMFSQFTQMGTETGAAPALTDRDESTETFLLSADFGELTGSTVPTGGKVSFSVRLEDGTEIKLGLDSENPATVSYTVTNVRNGEITADSSTVSLIAQPSGEELRNGKTVYLVGTLRKTDGNVKVPLNASAGLTASGEAINGQWISGDTVAFPLRGEYGNLTQTAPYTFSFEALPEGEYSITWKLCTGEFPNVMNGVCSNDATSTMSVAAKTQPSLSITAGAISCVLAAGSDHTVSFEYDTTSSFTVTMEKQGILGSFGNAPGTTAQTVTVSQPGEGTVTAKIPGEKGTYRVCFSLEEDSRNDNVYYSFIVE